MIGLTFSVSGNDLPSWIEFAVPMRVLRWYRGVPQYPCGNSPTFTRSRVGRTAEYAGVNGQIETFGLYRTASKCAVSQGLAQSIAVFSIASASVTNACLSCRRTIRRFLRELCPPNPHAQANKPASSPIKLHERSSSASMERLLLCMRTVFSG